VDHQINQADFHFIKLHSLYLFKVQAFGEGTSYLTTKFLLHFIYSNFIVCYPIVQGTKGNLDVEGFKFVQFKIFIKPLKKTLSISILFFFHYFYLSHKKKLLSNYCIR